MTRLDLASALREGKVTTAPCDRCGGAGDPVLTAAGEGTVRVSGWRCYPCRRLPAGAYYVYVVELTEAAGSQAVYVGQSALFPAERFSQHLTGYKAASAVKRFGKCLRPDLFERYNPIPKRADAEAMEARLAEQLRKRGYKVYGGH